MEEGGIMEGIMAERKEGEVRRVLDQRRRIVGTLGCSLSLWGMTYGLW